MEKTKPKKLTWLDVLFVLTLALLFASLYEMLWAWIFAGNCCRVSAWYDMPYAFLLALALTTAFVVRRLANDSRVRHALWLLIALWLVEIPVRKYLGENQSSGLLAWYAVFPVIYLVGIGMIATTKKTLHSFLPFFGWGVVLILVAITFAVQRSLVFSGWGVGFEVILLVFQAWLLYQYAMLAAGNLKK